jgi:phage shock protein A
MARGLRMSAELGDWLAELCRSDPASAAEVAAALMSVMTAADLVSLAMVCEAAAEPIDPREVVDDLYQSVLEALQQVRREVADASWATVGAKRLLAESEGDAQADPAVRAWLRQAWDNAKRNEAELARRSQRLQSEVDAFRTSKETAKAMYTAAEATVRVQDAIEAASFKRHGPEGDNELAAQQQAVDAAEDHLREVAAQAARTLQRILDAAGPDAAINERRQPAGPVAGLLELRADPLGRDVRFLMALEPAGTITLLAVLDGEDAIAEHRTQAIRLAGDLLTDIRAGDWPPAQAEGPADLEVTFADAATFLARFFPADSGAIARRAADLAAAQTLAALRGDMSLADLSTETGISEQRLRDIEASGLRAAEVNEVAAYVRALGGRLTLTAKVGESAPVGLT